MVFFNSILERLDELCAAGTPYDAFQTEVFNLDARGTFILKELGYDPAQNKHEVLLMKSEDERMADIKAIQAKMADNPTVALTHVIHLYCRDIYRRVSDELMAFATDFKARRLLGFTISFSSFASTHSYSQMETKKLQVKAKLDEMEKQGYVIETNRNRGKVLVDCDANRKLLREYCKKTFGSEPWEIMTHKNTISHLIMHINYMDYSPLGEPEETPVADSDSLTADEAAILKKNIHDLHFALASYQMMEKSGQRQIILSLLRSHVYAIERITRVHGPIYVACEKEHAEVRAKNQEIRQRDNAVAQQALDTLRGQIPELLEDMEVRLNKHVNRMGFYLDKFCLMEYNQFEMVLSNDTLRFKEPEIKLDGISSEEDRAYYVYPTSDNLLTIQATMKQAIPSVEMTNYSVQARQGRNILQSISFLAKDAMDILTILALPKPDSSDEDD